MDSNEWVEKYKQIRPTYEQFTEKLNSLLIDLLKHKNVESIFEKRTKHIESFIEKIERKNYTDPLQDMKDFSGIRIIVKTLSDVDTVVEIIKKNFEIDEENSINKAEILSPDTFGYLSIHLIVKLDINRRNNDEWVDYKDFWAEIQVRTVLQHAWASISHFLDYKNQIDVPTNLRRKLNSLSAVLELADNNFELLINEINKLNKEYIEEINSNELNIEINVDSLKAYLENSDNVKYWEEYVQSLGVNILPFNTIDRDIDLYKFLKMETIAELDNILINSHEWGKKALLKYFKLRPQHGVSSAHILFYLVIGENLDVLNPEILRHFLIIRSNLYIDPAMKYNPKYKKLIRDY